MFLSSSPFSAGQYFRRYEHSEYDQEELIPFDKLPEILRFPDVLFE